MKSITFGLFLLLVSFNVNSQNITGIASVIDGDTIEIHNQRIRLEGIDAPESNQTCGYNQQTYKCGQKAAMILDALIGGKSVSCIGSSKDRYGRIIATCYLQNNDINAWLVDNGLAKAYLQYSKKYQLNQQNAINSKKGFWVGEFIDPWDYRKNK